jgi:hypothetical protein
VAITDLKFGKEFTAAIESKQVAEQDAERARFLVMKAEQEKRAVVIRAEGESESASLVSLATHNHLVNCPIHIGTPDIRIARLPVFQLHKPGHRILRVCQQALDLLGTYMFEGLLSKNVDVLLHHVPVVICCYVQKTEQH